jgi:hypothetical protein
MVATATPKASGNAQPRHSEFQKARLRQSAGERQQPHRVAVAFVASWQTFPRRPFSARVSPVDLTLFVATRLCSLFGNDDRVFLIEQINILDNGCNEQVT